jgi:cell division septation protein DedD
MADNNFRPFRSREPLAREGVDPMSDTARDPLAELARIIGQSDRVNQFDRAPRHEPRQDARHEAVQTLDEPLPAPAERDWAADDDYAEPDAPEQYPDQYAEENYVQPRLPDPYPSDRADSRYDERAPSIASQYSEPAEAYDDARDDEQPYDARYRDEDTPLPPPRPAGRQPALAPQSHDDEYEAEDQWDDQADRQSDDAEYYDDEAATKPRHRGLVVVVAMVGLVMIGAGGAFAYREMFGGAILAPSVPPVIKANDAPNKIVPNRSDAQNAASNPNGTTSGSPDKLVSREEQPVAVQPANAPPRVVSTIPVLPAPGAAPSGPPASVALAPPAATALPSAPPKVAAPGQATGAPLAGSGEPKKVHTVTIRSDQVGNPNAAAPAPAPTAVAPAVRPKATDAPPRATAPKASGNAPLAIVPVAQGAAPAPAPAAEPPPRSHVARTEAPSAPVATAPTAPAAAPVAGGYAVQVTSQRSEAEAQTEFKSLQAKFPGQLGSRQPIIHRADLGDKGTFYRALVGPFASSEAAAAMCSNLKAAGGSCIVQKN